MCPPLHRLVCLNISSPAGDDVLGGRTWASLAGGMGPWGLVITNSGFYMCSQLPDFSHDVISHLILPPPGARIGPVACLPHQDKLSPEL